MVKIKDITKRESYSVRLNPEMIQQLKHIAVDEKKPISLLIEQAITLFLQKYKKGKRQ